MAKAFSGWQFADVRLTADDKKAFQVWCESTHPDILEIMRELFAQGYKVSASFSVSNEAFCVTITGTDDCKINKGISMTSWSDDLEEAYFIAAYKHFVVSKEKAWSLAEKNKKAWG